MQVHMNAKAGSSR